MKEIPLTKGYVALVDDADYPLVSQHRWSARVHRQTIYAVSGSSSDGRRFLRMHRLILSAAPGQQVDHIDGNGLNNVRANLRFCTNAENQMNSKKQRRHTTSQYKGVSWKAATRNWAAEITLNGASKHLGKFATEIAAALAYDVAARREFGEFARTNF